MENPTEIPIEIPMEIPAQKPARKKCSNYYEKRRLKLQMVQAETNLLRSRLTPAQLREVDEVMQNLRVNFQISRRDTPSRVYIGSVFDLFYRTSGGVIPGGIRREVISGLNTHGGCSVDSAQSLYTRLRRNAHVLVARIRRAVHNNAANGARVPIINVIRSANFSASRHGGKTSDYLIRFLEVPPAPGLPAVPPPAAE